MRVFRWVAGAIVALTAAGASAQDTTRLESLVRAYPRALAGVEGDALIWRDGTRMPASDALPDKTLEVAIRQGSIADQLRLLYPKGPLAEPPPPDDDPGRIRNRAFFNKMYGDCTRGEVTPHLVPVVWLPHTWGRTVNVTSINGVATQLDAVSRELDTLPDETKRYLYPPGGTYLCRHVVDTGLPSMHAYGAAIDINVARSDYWLWRRTGSALPPYTNRIPAEIVAIFEKHGFIWGGKWSHFDTMHFEFRPELLDWRPGTDG